MTRSILSSEEIWRKYDAIESRLTADLSERMLELLNLQPGMRVLDLASGRGEPAIRAARRVGPSGYVLGIDSSEVMLEMAREKAALEKLSNIELRVMNAEQLDVAASFDAATVRWGLMYMSSPITALENVRRVLIPGGVLVAALWAEPERVPYYTLPRSLLPQSLPPIDFSAPGIFRYADPNVIARDFGRAGFTISQIEELDVPVIEGQTAAELVEWCRAFGLTRLLNDLPEEEQHAWEQRMIDALERLRTDGVIRLGGVTRLVVARS